MRPGNGAQDEPDLDWNEYAHHAPRGQRAPRSRRQGPRNARKKGSPFESSLEGALADDDASKLEGETEDDKKKAALGAAQPTQTAADLAAALAFAAQAKPADAKDAPVEGDAKIDAKTAGKAVDALDPKLLAAATDDAQAEALKTLAPTKTLAATPELPDDGKDANAKAANGKADPADVAVTAPVAPPTVPAVTPPAATPAPAVSAEALAKLHAVKVPEPAKSSSTKTESPDRTIGKATSTSSTTEASTTAPAKVSEADAGQRQQDAKDAPGGDSGTEGGRGDKPARMTLAQADKKAKIERAKNDVDTSADAQRVTAKIADPSATVAPVGVSTETAKTLTSAPANGADAAKAAEITVSRADGVSAKTEDTIRAAEAAGHKRTLASGEASGQITTAELGRVEVVAHAIGGANEAGRVEVHVRAVEEHAKQVIAANAESLREHVRVEVPNATVHVQKPQNDLLGNGTSGRDFSDKSAPNTSGDGGRGGRGDAPAAREATVKNPAVPVKGARVRFVL